MRKETKTKLILTKEERKVISNLYVFLNSDDLLDVDGVWKILEDIYLGKTGMAANYGYEIEITD